MISPNLKKALRGLKDYPVVIDPKWQADTRTFLMAKISADWAADRTADQAMPASAWQVISALVSQFARRASVGASLVVIVIISTVSVVHAANSALPGDRLYSVKRGLEKVKYNLALKDNKKIQLELKTAQLRVQELSLVVRNYSNTDSHVINEAFNDVSRQMHAVKYRLATLAVGDPARAVEMAKIFDKNSGESARTLKDAKNQFDLSPDSLLKAEVGKKVNLALLNLEQAGIDAVSVILENKGEANGQLEADVKSSLTRKLENTRASLEESKNKVQNMENKIRKGQVSLTPVSLDKEIDQAKVLVNQKGKEVLDDVQKSLDSGDLSGAVTKLAEGNHIVGNIEKKIENVEVKTPLLVPPGKVGLTPVE